MNVGPSPLKSRYQDRTKYVRLLLRELPVRENGEGAGKC